MSIEVLECFSHFKEFIAINCVLILVIIHLKMKLAAVLKLIIYLSLLSNVIIFFITANNLIQFHIFMLCFLAFSTWFKFFICSFNFSHTTIFNISGIIFIIILFMSFSSFCYFFIWIAWLIFVFITWEFFLKEYFLWGSLIFSINSLQ
jgi:hypothetical protein